jgi:hypothetical protein
MTFDVRARLGIAKDELAACQRDVNEIERRGDFGHTAGRLKWKIARLTRLVSELEKNWN